MIPALLALSLAAALAAAWIADRDRCYQEGFLDGAVTSWRTACEQMRKTLDKVAEPSREWNAHDLAPPLRGTVGRRTN